MTQGGVGPREERDDSRDLAGVPGPSHWCAGTPLGVGVAVPLARHRRGDLPGGDGADGDPVFGRSSPMTG